MPNHWESSARPLFVRTVFVNGNRHAILFEKDPLLNYGNSPFKKISRPNSSLSFASDRSLTNSESQDSNSDDKAVKLGSGGQRQRKDLSSELQSCLIKLQLASGNLESGIKSDEEKCFCNAKEPKRTQAEISKQKRHKWKRDKDGRWQHCEQFRGESKEGKLVGEKINRDSSYYYYNFERNNRKKNYCVVKISSNPSQFTLNCGGHKYRGSATERNNMVISATIQNLLMTERKGNPLDSNGDNSFLCESIDSIDLYWNSYLTRSYYNSLSERVFQWLDLASKRKNQKQKRNYIPEDDSSSSVERIFSGKTFTGESKKTEDSDKCDNKQKEKGISAKREDLQSGTTEFMGEPDAEADLCHQKLRDDSQECFAEGTIPATSSNASAERLEEAATNLVPAETDSNSPSEATAKICTNTPKTSLKIQDILLDYDLRENFDVSLGKRNTRKIKHIRGPPTFQTKCRQTKDLYSTEEEQEEEEEEEIEEENENVLLTPVNYWAKKIGKKKSKFEKYGEQTPCHCDRNLDVCEDKIKGQMLAEGFSERSQNIARTKPVLVQNVLSPQQRDEISSLREEKTIWGLEKGTGRPQLHIFMPSLLLREASDDSMSECENVLNLC